MGGKVDVLVMNVYPKANVKKALKELGIEKYIQYVYRKRGIINDNSRQF